MEKTYKVSVEILNSIPGEQRVVDDALLYRTFEFALVQLAVSIGSKTLRVLGITDIGGPGPMRLDEVKSKTGGK